MEEYKKELADLEKALEVDLVALSDAAKWVKKDIEDIRILKAKMKNNG